MELQIENIIAAYNTADDNGKNLLRTRFPNVEFERDKQAEKRPITERIKTFEDACKELGEEHPFVKEWHCGENLSSDLEAYLQLRVICAALNEGWEPQFSEDEERWYPWFFLYTREVINTKTDDWKKQRQLIETGGYVTDYCGFACATSADAPSSAHPSIGSRLCLKSEELATYCGRQFIDLWAAFLLTTKQEK